MASVNPKASKVFETDGLAGDYAQVGGVTNTAGVANNPTDTRSKVAKDFIDDQSVLRTEESGSLKWDDIRRATPESGP